MGDATRCDRIHPPRLIPANGKRQADKRFRLFFQLDELTVLDGEHDKSIQTQTTMIGG